MVAATCPSCPSRPVTCVRIGTRRAGNQDGMSRRTLTKVMASPVPTSIRATIAPAGEVVRAMSTWPPAMTSAPRATILREPMRSTSTPTGTCITAYMTSCRTAKTENRDAPIANRAVAYSAATLSEERWNTASPYARTPTPHTSQAREGKRTCLILTPGRAPVGSAGREWAGERRHEDERARSWTQPRTARWSSSARS